MCFFSKYTWVIPLKDQKGITITNAFQKTLNKSNSKRNKILADKGSEFHNRSLKSWLEKIAIEMYSTHNEEKSVTPERFIRTLKNEIYRYSYVTSVSKNVYIHELDDIVNECNITYHSTIKMKPADVKSKTYINSGKGNNSKDPKFKIVHIVKISKSKNIFAKGYTRNWSEEIFAIKKEIKGKKIVGAFYEKESQNTDQ